VDRSRVLLVSQSRAPIRSWAWEDAPLSISITWSSACRLSRLERPPPRATSSITLSEELKRSQLDQPTGRCDA